MLKSFTNKQKMKPGGNILKKFVLVLNQNYRPLSVTKVKRAIMLIYLEKADIVEEYGFSIHSPSCELPAPSIVKLRSFIHFKMPAIPLSKKNIIKRDRHTCQYCGAKSTPVTVDHIIPKTMGGKDSWENLVCACISCNNKKGNRTLEQAGLTLLSKPRRPQFFFILQHFYTLPDKRWRRYLFLNK